MACTHDPDSDNYVLSVKDFYDKVGRSQQAENILNYLLVNLDAQTAVIEFKYVDKSYLIDYSKFFSRSFEDVDRFTKRIHFFSNLFSQEEFECAVKENKEDIKDTKGLLSDLIANYLGFVVIKPLRDNKENVCV